MAIFLAGAALGVLQHLETHGLAEVSRTHDECGLQQGEEVLVGRRQNVTAF